jgi:hypothetical protein
MSRRGPRFGYRRKPKQPEWIIVFEATGYRLTSDDVATWKAELERIPLDRSWDKQRLELAGRIGAAEILASVYRRSAQ